MTFPLGLGFKARMTALAPAPPPFTPAALPNLSVWLDASDASSIVHSLGAVSQWSDKSGNNHHGVQPLAARQPRTGLVSVNNLNALDFDGTNHTMTMPAGVHGITTGANTVFVAGRIDVVKEQLLFNGQVSGVNHFNVSPFNGPLSARYSGTTALSLGTAAAGDSLLVAMRRNGTTQTAWRGGGTAVTNTSATSFTLSVLRLGSLVLTNRPLNGQLCEFVWYARSLTDAEVNQVGAYLGAKWGMTWTNI